MRRRKAGNANLLILYLARPMKLITQTKDFVSSLRRRSKTRSGMGNLSRALVTRGDGMQIRPSGGFSGDSLGPGIRVGVPIGARSRFSSSGISFSFMIEGGWGQNFSPVRSEIVSSILAFVLSLAGIREPDGLRFALFDIFRKSDRSEELVFHKLIQKGNKRRKEQRDSRAKTLAI